MTAFALQVKQTTWGSATWEIHSINHRYLDAQFYLPEAFSGLEPILREQLKSSTVKRGKLTAYLRCQWDAPITKPLCLNTERVTQLLQCYEQLTQLVPTKTPIDLHPIEILKWPEIIQRTEANYTNWQPEIVDLFHTALEELIRARIFEGQGIQGQLQRRLHQITDFVQVITQKLPSVVASQQEKLKARLAKAQLELDPQQIAHAIVLMSQKLDVSEELERITFHLAAFQEALTSEHPVGKRLDFLVKELHREANTLADKISNPNLSLIGIELKVLIEEMREHIQNTQ
jgi:uncharacterized protein (TIGR00255 family)